MRLAPARYNYRGVGAANEINNWKEQIERAERRFERRRESLLREVGEQARNYDQALEKLLGKKPGSAAYDRDLGRVWAEA
jgi:hypothetical protein